MTLLEVLLSSAYGATGDLVRLLIGWVLSGPTGVTLCGAGDLRDTSSNGWSIMVVKLQTKR